MLWDLIFEFFVKYIFGGTLAVNGSYYWYNGTLGGLYGSEGVFAGNTSIITIRLFDNTFSIGNYMSLIATIITMIIILIVIGHFIKKVFNLFGRII